MKQALIPIERIEQQIFFLRGEKVMLSTDLAALYQVEPRVLVQAVKYNLAQPGTLPRRLYVSVDRRGI